MSANPTLKSSARVLEPSTDALLAQALRVFSVDPVGARLRLVSALNRGVDRAMVTAMLAKSIANDDPEAALALLNAAIEKQPLSLTLWSQYWQVLAIDSVAAQTLRQSAPWQMVLNQRLRWLDSGAELRAILALLDVVDADHAAMGEPGLRASNQIVAQQPTPVLTTPRYLGHCRWNAQKQLIEGWVLDRWAIHEPSVLTVRRIRHAHQDTLGQGQLQADALVAWIAEAGISAVGSFAVKVGRLADCFSMETVSLAFANGDPLTGSPLACVAAWSMRSDASVADQSGVYWDEGDRIGCGTDVSADLVNAFSPTVDVLVPVYESRNHALACIQSLLSVRNLQSTPHEIVVLDDASQDPVLVDALQNLSDQGEIVLVRRQANLGFIRNINRGMAIHPDRDVVWLNADTHVTGNWLDRLRSAAYASDDTASATPWSNDGEFMTLAGKSNPEPMPSPEVQQQLDDVIRELDLPPEELVAGCGFCFYVKRQALNDVGYLDEIHLIDGYGEETDWCMRARQNGWRHVAATNLFVGHAGGQSFGGRKLFLAAHNNGVIRERYPAAQRLHDMYLQQDPLKPARQRIARARWQHWLDGLAAGVARGSAQGASTDSVRLITMRIRRSYSVVPESKRTDLTVQNDAEDLKSDIDLIWQVKGTDIQVTLKVNRQQPVLKLTYRLPLASAELVQDLKSLCERKITVTAAVVMNDATEVPDTAATTNTSTNKTSTNKTSQNRLRMPEHLSDLLRETLGSIQWISPVDQSGAQLGVCSVGKAAGQNSSHLSATSSGNLTKKARLAFDGLALIVDDLRDPRVVHDWVQALGQMRGDGALEQPSTGIQFIVTQNNPGTQVLRRTGLVAPMFCPQGLSWKQWLSLLDVKYAVTLAPETAFLDKINEELSVSLPVLDAHIFIRSRLRVKTIAGKSNTPNKSARPRSNSTAKTKSIRGDSGPTMGNSKSLGMVGV